MTTTEVHSPGAHHHDPNVAHQFEDAAQQKDSATIGMWTFLATEVLFFGALFVAYGICRLRWPGAFVAGSGELKWYFGGVNTAVLLMSSYFMAMSVHAAAEGHIRKISINLWLTIAMAVTFLGIKSVEYYVEYQELLIPGINFSVTPPKDAELNGFVRALHSFERSVQPKEMTAKSEEQRPANEALFFCFYFFMTMLHATHMVIGIGLMIWLIWLARKGKFSAKYHTPVEMTGLYWHFVDTVWVFLFPILYLLKNV